MACESGGYGNEWIVLYATKEVVVGVWINGAKSNFTKVYDILQSIDKQNDSLLVMLCAARKRNSSIHTIRVSGIYGSGDVGALQRSRSTIQDVELWNRDTNLGGDDL
ncbi:hypothetical protein Tco_0492177 [Tanacetum coccineum]